MSSWNSLKIPFYHIILGLGCDGESSIEKIKEMISRQQKSIMGEFSMDNIADIFSPIIDEIKHPERKNIDTTVVIVEAFSLSQSGKKSSNLEICSPLAHNQIPCYTASEA